MLIYIATLHITCCMLNKPQTLLGFLEGLHPISSPEEKEKNRIWLLIVKCREQHIVIPGHRQKNILQRGCFLFLKEVNQRILYHLVPKEIHQISPHPLNKTVHGCNYVEFPLPLSSRSTLKQFLHFHFLLLRQLQFELINPI